MSCLERFHDYIWRHRLTVHTDYKPLELIVLKNLQAPPRLARIIPKVEGCVFTIKHFPSKTVSITDCLSRVPSSEGYLSHTADAPQHIYLNIHKLSQHLNSSPTRLQTVREETMKDPSLNALTKVITAG